MWIPTPLRCRALYLGYTFRLLALGLETFVRCVGGGQWVMSRGVRGDCWPALGGRLGTQTEAGELEACDKQVADE